MKINVAWKNYFPTGVLQGTQAARLFTSQLILILEKMQIPQRAQESSKITEVFAAWTAKVFYEHRQVKLLKQ